MGGFLFPSAVVLGFTIGGAAEILSKIILVALGLGMVIFVHELGHFAVAKWCGVKCEKFYLGFDVWGKKFFSFQWGETEYGIGVLPLGGYVKMLGQDDNPNRQADEAKRSKAVEGSPEAVETKNSEGQTEPLDPRSYLAKSVPARMAIISAGVIMNMIFAFFILMVAYMYGVSYHPPIVSTTSPGQPAWVVGIQSGDEIYEIGGKRALTFDNIFEEVMLSNRNSPDGVPITVHRPDASERQGYRELKFKIPPERKGDRPMIGVAPAVGTTLNEVEPVAKNTPAADGSLKFEGGDKIVAINDIPIATYTDARAALSQTAAKAIQVKVSRRDAESGKDKEVSIPVAARPMKSLGLVMALGTISAVQADSPAAKAMLETGDLLVSFDGEGVGDPMTLPARLAQMAGKEIPVVVQRGSKTITLNLTLANLPPSPDGAMSPNAPLEIPALGVTCQVLSRVAKVVPDSPAAKAASGNLEGQILKVQILPDEKGKEAEDLLSRRFGITDQTMKLTPAEGEEPEFGWAFVFQRIQMATPGTQVKIFLEGDREATILPVDSTEFFLADRGLNFDSLKGRMRATSLGEALDLTRDKISGTIGTIYRFLFKLNDSQIAKQAGGPVRIAVAAYTFVSLGPGDFMLFLGMLSVNLAVINFLPIPVLDGGHMVFLAWEGVRGKPANEQFTFAVHMLGLALILCLVLFVFTLDTRFAFKMWQNWW